MTLNIHLKTGKTVVLTAGGDALTSYVVDFSDWLTFNGDPERTEGGSTVIDVATATGYRVVIPFTSIEYLEAM